MHGLTHFSQYQLDWPDVVDKLLMLFICHPYHHIDLIICIIISTAFCTKLCDCCLCPCGVFFVLQASCEFQELPLIGTFLSFLLISLSVELSDKTLGDQVKDMSKASHMVDFTQEVREEINQLVNRCLIAGHIVTHCCKDLNTYMVSIMTLCSVQYN